MSPSIRYSISLKGMKDVTEVSTDQMETVKEVQIKVNREKALQQGLAPAQIGTFVQDVTRGVMTTQMVTGSSEVINVFVQYDRNITENLEFFKETSNSKWTRKLYSVELRRRLFN